MKKLNKKGFTIVELVIVIAVIAILAGVLIPTFATVVEKANKSSAQQQAKNFYTLLEAATAAPTKYEMTGNNNKTTYTLSMQQAGLVVSKTHTGTEQHEDAEVILYNILGDDVKTYKDAKVGFDNATVNSFSSKEDNWIIKAVYFQPKGSEYVVKIDLVAGTVGEAVKAESLTESVTFRTFDGEAGN